jgi:ATP/maltotriose-dependent transcriptional regulator MalT
VLWIAAPPGSGKTTLVATWLAARRVRTAWLRVDAGDEDLPTFFHHLAIAARRAAPRARLPRLEPGLDPEVFARRFFRLLFASLRRRAVLVLDDLDEIAGDAPLQTVLRALLEELPRGAMAVLEARREPPASLAKARVERTLDVLRPRDLELTPDEAWALAQRHGFRGGRPRARELLRASHGWVTGFAFLLAGGGTAAGEEATFDYFAQEIFARADAGARRVLLESALLDSPSASLVVRATGNPGAARVLAAAARRGLFTYAHEGKDPAFEFHALFRAFLLRRGLDELPSGRAAEVRRTAAEVLVARGGADAEAAFALLVDAGALEEAAALAVRAAPVMLAQGRMGAVASWLGRLPPAQRDSDPWLRYVGAITELARDPERARAGLDRARALFEQRGDRLGVWLASSAALEAIALAGVDFTPVTGRIAELDAMRASLPLPTREVEARVTIASLAALVHHAPGHPSLSAAAAVARERALAPGDDRERLLAGAWYHVHTAWWLGDVDAVRPLVMELGPRARAEGADPIAAVMWLATESPFHLLEGDEAAAARTAAEAAAIAERHGVRNMDAFLLTTAIWGALARDEVAAASAAVDALRSRLRPGNPTDPAVLRIFEALVRLREGSPTEAILHAREAKAIAERASFATVHVFADCVLALASVRAGPARAAEAEVAFAEARRKVGAIGSPPFEHLLALADAERALSTGRVEEAALALGRAVPGARAGGLHARYLFSREELARLWALALRRGIARQAALDVIRIRALPPPADAGDEWPWPVRIRVLGTLSIERDGVAITGVPRRPLDLIRALVALGGREVEEGAIADALWPDADADAAQHALETTLYRLRRIVGPGVIVQRDRKLSISPDRCWVDARELERHVAAELTALERRPGATVDAERAARISALYRGPLFADARDAPWAVAARERVRRRLTRWLDALGDLPGANEAPAEPRVRLVAADPALEGRPALRLA